MNENILLERYEKYANLLSRVFEEDKVRSMLDVLGERIVLCPTSLIDGQGGNPGMLVETSLQVAQKSKMLAESHGLSKSAVRVALVHDLGRVGDLTEDLYQIQDSEWHRDKLNQNYKYNEKCVKMNIPHRSLYILQNFKIELTQDEWIAVVTSQGLQTPENSFYNGSQSILGPILRFSKEHVTHMFDT